MLDTLHKYRYYAILVTILLSFVMHFHVLNKDLIGIHVWRQTETQTVINNFVHEDFNILNPRINNYAHTDRIHRMEFPIMQWLFAAGHKVFGTDIIISRLLSLFISFLSIIGIYKLCSQISARQSLGVIAAWMFCFSPVFYYYSVNPLPDNFALCCSIWGLFYYFSYVDKEQLLYLILSGILLSLATLAKLPYVIFCSGALAYFIHNKNYSIAKRVTPLVAYTILLLPAIAWYFYVVPGWSGNGVVKGIFDTSTYTLSGLLEILGGTIISILPELLLNYGSVIFFLIGIYIFITKRSFFTNHTSALLILCISFFCYYTLEINMITTVHDYYLMPALPLLFIVCSYGCYYLLTRQKQVVNTIAIIALISLPVLAYIRIDGRWDENKPGFNSTYLHQKDELRDIIPDDSYCVVGNDNSGYITLYYLNKKGWTYKESSLNYYDLKFYIENGAEYLLTDDDIDRKVELSPLLGKKIFDNNQLKIFTLVSSHTL